jgi:hypothetical protein
MKLSYILVDRAKCIPPKMTFCQIFHFTKFVGKNVILPLIKNSGDHPRAMWCLWASLHATGLDLPIHLWKNFS